MKKLLVLAGLFLIFTGNAFSLDTDFLDEISGTESDEEIEAVEILSEDDSELLSSTTEPFDNPLEREVIIPEKKRPVKADEEKILKLQSENEEHNTNEYVDECRNTFNYGLEEEIIKLIDEFIKNEEMRFADEIYDLFWSSKNPAVKHKILYYFGKLKDPCLEDYAVTVLNDPYDESKETVNECFKYVSAVDCKEAIPCLVTLIDKEEDDYFNGALTALGEIGSASEAVFLAGYLDREDLSVNQKQSLMKVLGRIKAVETWDKLSEIAKDEDENLYVRMYAIEAIGAMEKEESKPILIKLYEESDPNIRVYVIKGLSHFKDEATDELLLQAIRDSQYKVRLEAVTAIKERDLPSAVPFLIYRCKDKSEQSSVKDLCFKVIAKFNTEEGNKYLVSQIKDRKTSDSNKTKIASALLENNFTGTEEIIALAKETMKSDARKNLRYSLGKEFAKYGREEFEEICSVYMSHKDVTTQGIGLDVFAKGKYENLVEKVREIAKPAIEEEEAEKKEQEEAEKRLLEEKNQEKSLENEEKSEENAEKSEDENSGIKNKMKKTTAQNKNKPKKEVIPKKKPVNANSKKAKRILSQLNLL